MIIGLMASGKIKDVQTKTIAAEKKNISIENHEVFDKILQGHRELVEIRGNAEFIKNIEVIINKGAYFSMFKITSDGLLNVNNNLVIDTKALLQIEKGERSTILELSKKLADEAITAETFDEDILVVGQKYRLRFEHARAQATAKICEKLQLSDLKDMRVGEQYIFKDIKPHEIDRLDQVFTHACKHYNQHCVKVGCKMAELMKCKNVYEFTAVVEYIIRQMDVVIKEFKKDDPDPPRPAGITAKKHYIERACRDFLTNVQHQEEMKNTFTELMRDCQKENSDRKPRFEGPFSAANHYDKHSVFPGGDPTKYLTPKRYFEIAHEMTRDIRPILTDPKWTQDGSSLYYQYRNENYQAIRYDNLANGTSVIATLMHVQKG